MTQRILFSSHPMVFPQQTTQECGCYKIILVEEIQIKAGKNSINIKTTCNVQQNKCVNNNEMPIKPRLLSDNTLNDEHKIRTRFQGITFTANDKFK